MTTIVIENRRPTLIELPNVAPVVDDAGGVVSEGYVAQQLLPGENNVDPNYWDKIVGNKGVRIFLAANYLMNRGAGKAREILKSLESLDPDVAKKHIVKCTSIELLNGWAESTDNRIFRKLIEERKLELIATADGRPEGEPVAPVGAPSASVDDPEDPSDELFGDLSKDGTQGGEE